MRRIQIGEMERASKEKREKIASIRSGAIRLLELKGKERDVKSNPDFQPKYFEGSFTAETIRVRFLIQSDNINPNKADVISISFPILNETLIIDSDEKVDLKVDHEISPGRVNTTISRPTHYQINQYLEMLNLIESKYPDPMREQAST